jgi:carbonic anhydrase/acetyltransferase-like protein (isoleucine patch superfamily)
VVHADPGQPVVLGTGVTVGHRAIIHSASVGDHSLIGMGATLLNRARIGSYCVIGAGALVSEDKAIADGTLALGAPARPIRSLDDEQRKRLELSAAIYVANSRRFREGLQAIGS